jgi:hypothetical protein
MRASPKQSTGAGDRREQHTLLSMLLCPPARPTLAVGFVWPCLPTSAPQIVQGSASFGEIITRDRHSGAHLVMAGRAQVDSETFLGSQRLAIAFEALGRSYEWVTIDASTSSPARLTRNGLD